MNIAHRTSTFARRLAIIAAGCALVLTGTRSMAQDAPSWASELPNLPQRTGWYQGLGITKVTGDGAADWDDASGKARAQIAAQIRVRISSTVTRAIQETASNTEITVADAYASTTEQLTTATLEGILLERWFDEDTGTLYAYGAISQAEVERRFRERMEDALASARIYHAGARRALERNDPFTAFGQLMEAIKVVTLAEAALDRTISASLEGTGASVPILPVLNTQVCGMFSRLQFEILGGDNQDAERSKALAVPLQGRLLFRSDRGTYPVANAVIAAAFLPPATGRVTAEARTSSTGEFSMPVLEVLSGEAVNRIRLTLGLQGVAVLAAQSPELTRCWSTSYVDYTFRMRSRTNIAVAIRILETNMGSRRAQSAVQEEIQRRLLGGRYTIVEDSKALAGLTPAQIQDLLATASYNDLVTSVGKSADVAIVGEVSTVERSNPYPQMYFGSGRAVIRIIDCKTGMVLGSVNMENEKEAGATYDHAGRKLLEKMGKSVADVVLQEMKKALE
ncbi:MAG: LPP20 family lipoprotein [Bacteroidetes bacterium]|nr:LPP20 family lipoprotein [Bacteroidota bacterium]